MEKIGDKNHMEKCIKDRMQADNCIHCGECKSEKLQGNANLTIEELQKEIERLENRVKSLERKNAVYR